MLGEQGSLTLLVAEMVVVAVAVETVQLPVEWVELVVFLVAVVLVAVAHRRVLVVLAVLELEAK